jgi:hypothetical protein
MMIKTCIAIANAFVAALDPRMQVVRTNYITNPRKIFWTGSL